MKNTRYCKYKKLLIEFADGHLDRLRFQEIQSHIEKCPSCKKELDELRSSMDLIGNSILSDTPRMPERFSKTVLDRLYQEQKENSPPIKNFALKLAIIVCVFIIAIVVFLKFSLLKPKDVWIQDLQFDEKLTKTDLPKKMIISERKTDKNLSKSEMKNNSSKKSKTLLNAVTTKTENKSDDIIKIEMIKILNQALEIIEGDEQECEVVI